MELSFSELKAKEIVNTQDGKKLGRICDLLFSYPENRVYGFTVPSGKSGFFKKEERFVSMQCIVKIGEDVILVNLPPLLKDGKNCPPERKPSAPPHDRRSYEEYE